MNPRLIIVSVALLGLSGYTIGQTPSPGGQMKAQPMVQVNKDTCDPIGALEWCSRDHGFNEGAICGASALAGFPGTPNIGSGPILGNLWDRTAMMSLARDAAKAGRLGDATKAAICCQIHNQQAAQCLAANTGTVQKWLLRP